MIILDETHSKSIEYYGEDYKKKEEKEKVISLFLTNPNEIISRNLIYFKQKKREIKLSI